MSTLKPYSLNEATTRINDLMPEFNNFLLNVLEVSKTQKINLVGIGNSISAGWTAIDNDVRPWIEKLKPFLEENNIKDLDVVSFSIAQNNSNKEILELINQNPSLAEIKDLFIKAFDSWKKTFDGTSFQNYVDRDQALSYYHDSKQHFNDFYNNDNLTLTSFNGCTGELINYFVPSKDEDRNIMFNKILKFLLSKHTRDEIFESELEPLKELISLITSKSNHSYLTVGNFPHLCHPALKPLNKPINRLNKKIELTTLTNNKSIFYNDIELQFIYRYNGKIKFDNHPNIEWQYTILYHYLIFLMKTLPQLMIKNEENQDKTYINNKYKKLI